MYLSYLMGAENIEEDDLTRLGVDVIGKTDSGSFKLEISEKVLPGYITCIKEKLSNGFWNEIVGPDSIIFIFKFKDGRIEEYMLYDANEEKIAKLCSEFSGDSEEITKNVYKYIAGNDFYSDMMNQYHKHLIMR